MASAPLEKARPRVAQRMRERAWCSKRARISGRSSSAGAPSRSEKTREVRRAKSSSEATRVLHHASSSGSARAVHVPSRCSTPTCSSSSTERRLATAAEKRASTAPAFTAAAASTRRCPAGSRVTRRFVESRVAPSPAQRIPEDGARLDRGELVGVPQQEQARSFAQGAQQTVHRGQNQSSTPRRRSPRGGGADRSRAGRSGRASATSRAGGAIVCGSGAMERRPTSAMSIAADARPAAIACFSRCAAFPVGAAIATESIGTPVHQSARSSATTMVVFPVPGPPVMSASGAVSAARTARFCSSVSGGGPGGHALERLLQGPRVDGDGLREPLPDARAEALLQDAHALGVEPGPLDDHRRAGRRDRRGPRRRRVSGAGAVEERADRGQRVLAGDERQGGAEARVERKSRAPRAHRGDAGRGKRFQGAPRARVEALGAASDLPAEVGGVPLASASRGGRFASFAAARNRSFAVPVGERRVTTPSPGSDARAAPRPTRISSSHARPRRPEAVAAPRRARAGARRGCRRSARRAPRPSEAPGASRWPARRGAPAPRSVRGRARRPRQARTTAGGRSSSRRSRCGHRGRRRGRASHGRRRAPPAPGRRTPSPATTRDAPAMRAQRRAPRKRDGRRVRVEDETLRGRPLRRVHAVNRDRLVEERGDVRPPRHASKPPRRTTRAAPAPAPRGRRRPSPRRAERRAPS